LLAWSRRKPANIFHIKIFPLKLLLQAKLIFNIFRRRWRARFLLEKGAVMQNINDLEQALESLKMLIKAKKDYEKLSAKYANVSFKDVTRSQRARINERLGDAAFDVKVKTDNLHADLVDAGLCEMKERYEQRELGQSAGLGHIYRAAYLPKVPKRYKELQK